MICRYYVIQFYFRCLRFLAEAFFDIMCPEGTAGGRDLVSHVLTIKKQEVERNEKETGSSIIISSYVCSGIWRMWSKIRQLRQQQ